MPGLPEDATTAAITQPVRDAERLVSLDFIRGVAVLGILFANITAFAHPSIAYFWPPALPGGGNVMDGWIWLAQFVLVDGKFRGVFTLLFGAGMCLFIDRMRDRDEEAEHVGATGLQLRRLFFLLLFGLAHFLLLFTGDILALYAVSGFLALAFVDWSVRRQLGWGLVWYGLGTLLMALALATPMMLEIAAGAGAQSGDGFAAMEAEWAARIAVSEAERYVHQHGSFAAIAGFRAREELDELLYLFMLAFIETLPLMLIGMGLYRAGLFSGRLEARRLRLWAWIGVISGALSTAMLGYWALAEGFPPFLTSFVFNGASAFTRMPMILGLIVLLALWAPRAVQFWLGARITAAGRMAFSNYIGSSLLMVLIFDGWAGGLYGELHRVALLPVVALGWAAMLAWSKPWLGHFRYGPLEWLWRCLTYGRHFPIRR